MIPKILHYFKDETSHEVLDTWTEHCPDWELRAWDYTDSELEVHKLLTVYRKLEYADLIKDYIKLHTLYSLGGVFVDGNVKLTKGLDDLLGNEMLVMSQGDYVSPALLGSTQNNLEVDNLLEVLKNNINGNLVTVDPEYRLVDLLNHFVELLPCQKPLEELAIVLDREEEEKEIEKYSKVISDRHLLFEDTLPLIYDSELDVYITVGFSKEIVNSDMELYSIKLGNTKELSLVVTSKADISNTLTKKKSDNIPKIDIGAFSYRVLICIDNDTYNIIHNIEMPN